MKKDARTILINGARYAMHLLQVNSRGECLCTGEAPCFRCQCRWAIQNWKNALRRTAAGTANRLTHWKCCCGIIHDIEQKKCRGCGDKSPAVKGET